MKPKLKEVKAYFKNAKEVIDINKNKVIEIDLKTIHYDMSRFWVKFNDYNYIIWAKDKGYAEIISYKDTYTVSKEFILDLHANPTREKIENEFKDLFPKPKTKLTISEIEEKLGYEIEIVK